MDLQETIEVNDALRSQFKGGRVLLWGEANELDPQLRGRLLDRLTRYSRFEEGSDHSEGEFVFAAYRFAFEILEGEERTLVVYLIEDLLLSPPAHSSTEGAG